MFPSFPRYKEGTGGRGQIEPGPPVVLQDSTGPRQIVCDLPMMQRGPAEEACM